MNDYDLIYWIIEKRREEKKSLDIIIIHSFIAFIYLSLIILKKKKYEDGDGKVNMNIFYEVYVYEFALSFRNV